MTDWDAKRRNLKTQLECGVIDRRVYAKRLRGINAAEGSHLARDVKRAVEALNAYRDRIDRGRVQAKMLRELSRSLRRYEELPE